MQLTNLTATEVVAGISARKFNAEEVAKAFLDRTAKLKNLNIYVHLDDDVVLNQARDVDRRLAAGEAVGPLAGLPVAIKDLVCVQGEPTTCGSKMLANPMMLSDDEPIPFDNSVYSIEIAERENYDWPCGKCGHPQGDHAGMILDPPAGDCEYAPRQQENKVTDQFHPAPIEFEPEQIAADPILKFFHYAHLPPTLQERSAPFCKLAQHLVANLPRNAERTVALRKLLEAKDAAVRAAIPA